MPHLLIIDADRKQSRYDLERSLTRVGRLQDNEIVVADETVTRSEHCRIERHRDDRYYLHPGESRNPDPAQRQPDPRTVPAVARRPHRPRPMDGGVLRAGRACTPLRRRRGLAGLRHDLPVGRGGAEDADRRRHDDGRQGLNPRWTSSSRPTGSSRCSARSTTSTGSCSISR